MSKPATHLDLLGAPIDWRDRKYMNRRSPLQVVVALGVASAGAGLLLQLVERLIGVKPGALRWMSAMVASSVAGAVVGRRGRGFYAVLGAGEAGLGTGAVDGALRATALYLTDSSLREGTQYSLAILVVGGTLGSLGTVCGCIAGLLTQAIVALRRLW
jgi:hypothetical protein